MNTLRSNNISPLLKLLSKFLLAISFTALAGWIAVHESEAYYAAAPFHYDSASYLAQALQTHQLTDLHGRISAFLQTLHYSKDSLDLSLRILFAPSFLTTTFGHMLVLLPFMGLFIFLVIHYVYQRTQLWLASIAVISFLFCFPIIYSPYTGIADYWKESIAVWMLGGAIMSWLLSDMLNQPRWSILCGILLGLLVMERTALAIYAAMLFAPLFLIAAYQRFRHDSTRTAFIKLSALVLPASLLSAIVGAMQWDILYHYYFVAGYGYGSPAQVAKLLLQWILHRITLPVLMLSIIYCFSLYLISDWKKQGKDIAICAWFALGFPLIIIMTHGQYHAFCNIWLILLITLLASVIPQKSFNLLKDRLFYILFLGLIVLTAVNQYFYSANQTGEFVRKFSAFRPFYEQIIKVVMQQPAPRYFSLLFAEETDKIMDHVQLNQGITDHEMIPVGKAFTHDTYYDSKTATTKLAEDNLKSLEAHDRTIVVTYCHAQDISQSPVFEKDAANKAIPMIAYQTEYLSHSPHWRAIKKIISPYGCVYFYEYSKTPLTDYIKWHDVTPL